MNREAWYLIPIGRRVSYLANQFSPQGKTLEPAGHQNPPRGQCRCGRDCVCLSKTYV
jgi:hypothetical protein